LVTLMYTPGTSVVPQPGKLFNLIKFVSTQTLIKLTDAPSDQSNNKPLASDRAH
jgi:hypothetical protein